MTKRTITTTDSPKPDAWLDEDELVRLIKSKTEIHQVGDVWQVNGWAINNLTLLAQAITQKHQAQLIEVLEGLLEKKQQYVKLSELRQDASPKSYEAVPISEITALLDSEQE